MRYAGRLFATGRGTRCLPVGLLILTCGFGGPAPAYGQEVQGLVLSDLDRSPIEAATVTLTDLKSNRSITRVTNRAGTFDVDRAPGRISLLEVSALGYQTHVDTLYLAEPVDSLTLEIRLGVDAIPLDALVVVASRRPVWESTQPKYLWEFFERAEYYGRRSLDARFYDRQALKLRFGPIESISLLSTLSSAATYARELRFMGGCSGDVHYLDGMLWRGDLTEIPWGIGDLAAVEVYDGGGPGDLQPHPQVRNPCRTLVMWTQRPLALDGEEVESAGWFFPTLTFIGLALLFTVGSGG